MNACEWTKWLSAVAIVGVLAVGARAADKNKPKDDANKAGVFGDDTTTEGDEEFGVGNKSEPAGGKRKAKKVAKEEPAEKKEAVDDKPAEAKNDEPAKEDGFGAGQAAAKDKTSKGLDPADLASNKDLAAYVKRLKKQFKKEDGYYLVTTIERGMEPDADAAKDQDTKLTYKPYETIEFQVLEGQESAVAFVVEYLGKYNPPWEKKSKSTRSSKGKRDAGPPAPPSPQRDFKVIQWFPEGEEGQQAAEQARTLAEAGLAAAKQQQEERNKPVNKNAR